MRVGGQRHAPVALPLRKTRYALYRRLGGPQGYIWYDILKQPHVSTFNLAIFKPQKILQKGVMCNNAININRYKQQAADTGDREV